MATPGASSTRAPGPQLASLAAPAALGNGGASPPSVAEPCGPFAAPKLAGDHGPLEDLLASVTCTVPLGGAYRVSGAWSVPTRVTANHVLCIGSAGEMDIAIGDAHYRLGSDSVVLAPAHVPQAFHKVSLDELCFYTVHFQALVYGVLDMPSLYGLATRVSPASSAMTEFEAAARRIVNEYARAEPGCTLAAAGECARLLSLYWRATLAEVGGIAARDAARVDALTELAPVFRAIQARHAEPLRVRDLARIAHLHPAWFSTRFKRITGLPPVRYLTRYRLERVRELLVSTDHSVGEIAALTGFQDPLYLSRQFHRELGVSPTAYRRAGRLTARLLPP
jgi:AraC-like DNA-binding protein